MVQLLAQAFHYQGEGKVLVFALLQALTQLPNVFGKGLIQQDAKNGGQRQQGGFHTGNG